jgi:hypothetical protein
MPHYDNSTWNFARGATATIDRDLGFLDTHLFHDIIGTHVCHHLISTIPFYNAGEASKHIKKVMGVHYKADLETPFWTAFVRNQRTCKFVEETEGQEGSGVYCTETCTTVTARLNHRTSLVSTDPRNANMPILPKGSNRPLLAQQLPPCQWLQQDIRMRDDD